MKCLVSMLLQYKYITHKKSNKMPLDQVTTMHCKHRRPIITSLDEFCATEGQDKTDVCLLY